MPRLSNRCRRGDHENCKLEGCRCHHHPGGKPKRPVAERAWMNYRMFAGGWFQPSRGKPPSKAKKRKEAREKKLKARAAKKKG